MCCFSVAAPAGWLQRLFPPRVHVSATNIFARMIEPGVQALAYGMNLDTRREVAMVLPLPIARVGGAGSRGHAEDAVTFIDLAGHAHMFAELHALFPAMLPRKGGLRFTANALQSPQLVVHEVGSFIASYVPTRADFTRLDARFRLPSVLFDAVPAYEDYGFAVFQLKPGKTVVHPMAFTFPTREPRKLFFPTVHVHDGRWHATADFDHALYFQRSVQHGYETSQLPTVDYKGLVEPGRALERDTARGSRANADIWIPS